MPSPVKSVVVQIGNTDNKLTQAEWSHFVVAVNAKISEGSIAVHFMGGSAWDAPWQNACWVCGVLEDEVDELLGELTKVRKAYKQNSIAVQVGDTQFI